MLQMAKIVNTYGNKFIIPVDFEMLDSAMPYYHWRLRNQLCYEIRDWSLLIPSTRAEENIIFSPKNS